MVAFLFAGISFVNRKQNLLFPWFNCKWWSSLINYRQPTKALFPEMRAWKRHLISEKAPPAARDRSEVSRAKHLRYYHHVGYSGLNLWVSKRPSLLVEFVHPGGRYLLAPCTENKKGSMRLTVLRARPIPTRVLLNILYTALDNALLHFIPNVWWPWGDWLLRAQGTI